MIIYIALDVDTLADYSTCIDGVFRGLMVMFREGVS
jgi:hypothetical protein